MECGHDDYAWEGGQFVCQVCRVIDFAGAQLVRDVRRELEAQAVEIIDPDRPTPR